MPRREHHDGSIRWGHPYYRAVYMMVTNPIYAGTYAYGRTQIVRDVDAEGNRKVHRRFKAMAEWESFCMATIQRIFRRKPSSASNG